MQACDPEPRVATAPVGEGATDAPVGQTIPQLREILDPAEQTARDILEDEEALRRLRQRFEHAEDPALQGELAVEALAHVERQLQLTRERRRRLDSTEAKLWARQNRLEGFLIHARGSAWWHARRNRVRTETDDTEVPVANTNSSNASA
jgi:DNA helicase IV